MTGERRRAGVLLSTLSVLAATCAGCAAPAVPDPRGAVRAYTAAAAHGDADALYGMLASSSQRALGRGQVRQIVADERTELAEQARDLGQADVRVEASVHLRFADGEQATLDLREGRYGVTSAGALPGGGRTPREALDQLRRVLARRSYDGLIRVLSSGTRSAVESDLRGLVDGLSEPDALPLKVDGDEARVFIPGGHMVTLKREGWIWHVQNFD